MTAYPNPAQDAITVEFAFDVQEDLNVSLVSASGQLISTVAIQNGNMLTRQTFDLTELANGNYFVKVNGDSVNQVKRIVKK